MKSVSITVLTIAVYLLMPALIPANTPENRSGAIFAAAAASPFGIEGKALLVRVHDDENGRAVKSREQGATFAVKLPVTAAEILELVELAPSIYLPSNELVFSKIQVKGPADLILETQDDQLEAFAGSLASGAREEAVGVYVPGLFALPVIQQPQNQAVFVSDKNDTITQFSTPTRYGSTGLLAHNFLSGKRFFELEVGMDVVVIHGDGHRDLFRISQIEEYQALTPNSPYSQFINLDDPSQAVLSAGQLFNQIYSVPDQVVFQTCIEAFGDLSWGRIFVIAERVEE